MKYPDGRTVQYLYRESGLVGSATSVHALTGVIDESGQRYSTTRYDTNTRVLSTFLGSSADTYTFSYQPAKNGTYSTSSAVTTPDGQVLTSTYSVINGLVQVSALDRSCTGCATLSSTYTYGTDGKLTSLIRAGLKTEYGYDANGQLTLQVEAANDQTGTKRTTETDWHAMLRKPVSRRVYDAAHVLTQEHAWTYNVRGQELTSTQHHPLSGLSRTTTRVYCEQADVDAGVCPLVGLTRSMDGPRTDASDITTFEYRSSDASGCQVSPATCSWRKGDLWKVTNPRGQVTETLRYDGAGRVLSRKDRTGVITDFNYDSRGRLTSRTARASN